VIEPAVAVKVADVDPWVMLSEAGTVSRVGTEFPNDTVTPPVVAALLRVTVQVVEAFEARDDAVHCRPVTAMGATTWILADALDPLRDAVMVTL